ncbi:hypothetical protein EIN_154580 [Entamoeba invadens IP1]|uniref:Rho-GAP domain-containing protein n=1 Tax=Entamoeba invadens IP1 TaxID=370355 RepID=A0A0A1UF21_ENTIV|nr:hypothetical protein EIN_154580 [Entamoeba invadens IP1]ELP91391.1 hypothetical protein EIN_154580 [Entamoeba invadens IP1]|eukprot:XP_004258162.1 hypothetical protein EIN_154580 [Entamoeba invadens IP1]
MSSLACPGTHLFSVDLDTLMSEQRMVYPDLSVPLLLVLLRDTLYTLNAQTVEGIFRVPGTQEDIDCYKDLFNTSKFKIYKECSCNTIAGLFKLFLRELPTPAIPTQFYDNFVDEDTITAFENNKDTIMEKLNVLPENYKNLVLFIVHFLKDFSKFSNETKMGVDNLAMVFSACMLVNENLDPFAALTKTNLAKSCLAAMINGIDEKTFETIKLTIPNYNFEGLTVVENNPVVGWKEEKDKERLKDKLNEKRKDVKQKKTLFRSRDKTMSKPENINIKNGRISPVSKEISLSTESLDLPSHKRVTSVDSKTEEDKFSTSSPRFLDTQKLKLNLSTLGSPMFDLIKTPTPLSRPSFFVKAE